MDQHPTAQERINALRAERGYLLAFHELWLRAEPQFFELYEPLYQFLAYDEKAMSNQRREFIWIAALSAAREDRGVLHLTRGLAAGLSTADAFHAVALSSCSGLFDALRFSAHAWNGLGDAAQAEQAYLGQFQRLAQGLDPITAHLAAACAMSVARQPRGCELHFAGARDAGASEREMVEAASIAFWPGGAPALMLAADALKKQLPPL